MILGIPSGLNNNNSDENLAIESNMVEEEKLSKFSFNLMKKLINNVSFRYL